MKWVDEIAKMLADAIADAKCKGESAACITYDTNDGYIDVWCNEDGEVQIYVTHDENRDTPQTNIEQAIQDAMPCWEDVETGYDDYDPLYDYRYC